MDYSVMKYEVIDELLFQFTKSGTTPNICRHGNVSTPCQSTGAPLTKPLRKIQVQNGKPFYVIQTIPVCKYIHLFGYELYN